jgi:hypothetical protein
VCLCRGSICYVSVNLVLWGLVLCSEVRCVVAKSGVAHTFLCMGGCKLHCWCLLNSVALGQRPWMPWSGHLAALLACLL